MDDDENDPDEDPEDGIDARAPGKGQAPISDNPLDAPASPKAEGIDDEDDEEMADVDPDGDVGAIRRVAKGDPRLVNGDAASDTIHPKMTPEATARSHLVAQTHSIVLPSYSTWFDMHTIKKVETMQLPEFFNNRNRSKTPSVYKDYRDFMINTYRLNPAEYLTVTACRRNLAGDVCAIMRVHAFLEQWGLINYQVDAQSRPSAIGPSFTGHFRVTTDIPRGLQPFQPAPNSVFTTGKPFAATEKAKELMDQPKARKNLEIRREAFDKEAQPVNTSTQVTALLDEHMNGDTPGTGDDNPLTKEALENAITEPRQTFHCNSCGIDCTRVRYHNAKTPSNPIRNQADAAKAKYDLCPSCFMEGRFPVETTASEFVRLDDPYTNSAEKEKPWSEQELLLLLEGLEMFDDKWEDVAEHVRTRSKEECVLQFLKLEIEDPYLEEDKPTPELDVRETIDAFTSGRPIPFSQADNPVISVVSYLCSMLDPATAAIASGKTISEVRQQMQARFDMSKGPQPSTSTPHSHSNHDDTPNSAMTNGDTHTSPPAPGSNEGKATSHPSMDIDAPSHKSPSKALTMTNNSTAPTPADQQLERSNPRPDARSLLTNSLSARATFLASHEERYISSLVHSSVSTLMEKLTLKMTQFAELEAVQQQERQELERQRRELFLDRMAFARRVESVEAAVKGLGAVYNSGALGEGGEGERVKGMVREVRRGLLGGGLGGAGAGAGIDGTGMRFVGEGQEEAEREVKPWSEEEGAERREIEIKMSVDV